MNIEIRVEEFQFIDNLDHIISPSEVYEESELDTLLEKVKKSFTEAGWEGDGNIGLIWVPPFAGIQGNSMGEYIWHVKQDNNGISFLGYIEYEIENCFSNNTESDDEVITITEELSKHLEDFVDEYSILIKDIKRFQKETEYSSLHALTLSAFQNQIISELVDYIDECYLQFVEHVIGQNNPDRLKLTKTKVNLPLDVISAGVEDGYLNSWLILKNVSGALWKDFKFWSFREKFKEVCKSIDFTCPDTIKQMLLKHVEIRNSIQHHNGQFTKESSKILGQQQIVIIDDDNKENRVEIWDSIILSTYEVEKLLLCIREFVELYEKHIQGRMQTRNRRFIRV